MKPGKTPKKGRSQGKGKKKTRLENLRPEQKKELAVNALEERAEGMKKAIKHLEQNNKWQEAMKARETLNELVMEIASLKRNRK